MLKNIIKQFGKIIGMLFFPFFLITCTVINRCYIYPCAFLYAPLNRSNLLFKELNKFTVDSRFNYIGSFLIQCPKCGAKPETALDNFFPLDIETIFFGLLFRPSQTD